jgi:hypothetical protein
MRGVVGSHHADRVADAVDVNRETTASMNPPEPEQGSGRPYDVPELVQRTPLPGHEHADPRESESPHIEHQIGDRTRALGLDQLERMRGIIAGYERATPCGEIVGAAERNRAERRAFLAAARKHAQAWHEAGCPPPQALEVEEASLE